MLGCSSIACRIALVEVEVWWSILPTGMGSWPLPPVEDFGSCGDRISPLAAVSLRSAGAWRRCQRSAVSFPEPTLGRYSVVNLLYKLDPGGPLRARYPSS